MEIDKYLLLIEEQLRGAENNEQVEMIILQSIADMEGKEGPDLVEPFLIKLQGWLENLSPLDWDSTQWSCFRYAFIFLRKFPMIRLV